MRSIAAMLLLYAGSLFAQAASKPLISAFFDRIDDGPAFFIECPNTSEKTLSSGAEIWTSSIKIDGSIVPQPESELGPGLTKNIGPGEIWRGILALRQSYHSFYPAVKFGAMVRNARALTIAEGKHTITVQCGGTWSDEFTFYWDPEKSP